MGRNLAFLYIKMMACYTDHRRKDWNMTQQPTDGIDPEETLDQTEESASPDTANSNGTNAQSDNIIDIPSATNQSGTNGPALHLDIQVHIDASASPDQIDHIFASMARHLYGREL